MNREEERFPDHLITSLRRSQFHSIENGDIATEENLDQLINLMFHYPERDFYLFASKDSGVNHLVLSAEQLGVLRIEVTEMQYYPHPNYKHDWIKIDKPDPTWDWEKEVRENSPEFMRCTLKLTDRWRRKLDLQEALADSKSEEGQNPFLLKPSFYGLGIDLPKAWKWLKGKFGRKP